MKFEEFVERVQHRAHLPSSEDALAAIGGTLRWLGQRLEQHAAREIAGVLPRRIAQFLQEDPGRAFPGPYRALSREQFIEAARTRETIHLPDPVYHARAVLDVMREAVDPGRAERIRARMPEDLKVVFGPPPL